MRLASITVEKFRSITKAYKIGLGPSTVLVGPNNEGKSNILRALAAAMNLLTRERLVDPKKGRSTPALFRYSRFYDWSRDFPVALQTDQPTGQSVITLEFALTEEERKQYKTQLKSKITGTLPLRIAFDRDGNATVTLHKKGPGAKEQSKKSREIARFVAERIWFEHIQAVRTARSAQEIVEELVARELSLAEADPRFQEALKQIAELQQPLLDQVSSNIKQTLVAFLPEVNEVKVQIPQESRYEALRRACQIVIDDGTPTLLQYKGDGVQSLAALGIMRHVTETSAAGRNLVLAVEEPESHLHPTAIHALRAVLATMATTHQVVITTHNPLFVDRLHCRSNIIVRGNRAKPAANIDEIRTILGVRAADNLRHAELVLVVEGEDDQVALTAMLCARSPQLTQAFSNHALAVDCLGGSGNLPYKLSILRQSLCSSHVFLDDDGAGKTSCDAARSAGLLEPVDVHFATSLGKSESELEDWYSPSAYEDVMKNKYGVSLKAPEFSSAKKWSVHMKETFKRQGKSWDDLTEIEVKASVARAIAANPSNALLPSAQSAFDALRDRLVARLEEIRAGRNAV
jgi:predicted ATP-dependent endonuclease of OLD family